MSKKTNDPHKLYTWQPSKHFDGVICYGHFSFLRVYLRDGGMFFWELVIPTITGSSYMWSANGTTETMEDGKRAAIKAGAPHYDKMLEVV